MTSCISCGTSKTLELISIDRIPILCNELHNTVQDAKKAPVGRMDLNFCPDCGHYFNRSFDPALIYYSANYETSLYASAVFREYADSLVQRLVSNYDVRHKKILEIGCGRGEFLRQLCKAGGNRGIGFDTSTPVTGKDPKTPSVSYVNDYFSTEHEYVRADLIVCQQVLEHIEDPSTFLSSLAQTRTFQVGKPVFYLEVPNGLYTAKKLGIWDLIYEHISYFTPTSLRRLVESSGFKILNMGSSFGGQYLYVEAQASTRGQTGLNLTASSADIETAEAFANSFERKVSEFRTWILDTDTALDQTYVWGAGSKGITFCNLVDPEARLAGLIDRNLNKHRKYIAGTGIGIYRLEDIDSSAISNIVIMNPQYVEEIGIDLQGHGVPAKLVSAMEVSQ